MIAAVKAALTDVGIDLPFLTRVILWHDQTEAIDGDRRISEKDGLAEQTHLVSPAKPRLRGSSSPNE